MAAKQAEQANRQDEEEDRKSKDRELAERAKMGDTEAFGELIHAHRHRAKLWAQRLTEDPHLADDIVQEALIKAFLHVSTLADTNRFLPWLHRIVQKQAKMRLRREALSDGNNRSEVCARARLRTGQRFLQQREVEYVAAIDQ